MPPTVCCVGIARVGCVGHHIWPAAAGPAAASNSFLIRPNWIKLERFGINSNGVSARSDADRSTMADCSAALLAAAFAVPALPRSSRLRPPTCGAGAAPAKPPPSKKPAKPKTKPRSRRRSTGKARKPAAAARRPATPPASAASSQPCSANMAIGAPIRLRPAARRFALRSPSRRPRKPPRPTGRAIRLHVHFLAAGGQGDQRGLDHHRLSVQAHRSDGRGRFDRLLRSTPSRTAPGSKTPPKKRIWSMPCGTARTRW